MNQNTKMLIGALVAAALAIAGYYGLVSPQQATSIQNQANQALGTTPQGTPASTQTGVPPGPLPQASAPTVPGQMPMSPTAPPPQAGPPPR